MAIKKFTIEQKIGTSSYNQLYPKTSADQVEGLGASAQDNVVSVAHGGTGATTASSARSNLGLGSVATESTVPVSKGGTGSTTVAGARNNLGLGNTSGAVPVANGGTGATTASAALTNLQAMGTAGGTFTGSVRFNSTMILSSSDYGTSLPSAGTAGRLFFKKV